MRTAFFLYTRHTSLGYRQWYPRVICMSVCE
nr:MAG TPA: hypothetical protein [Caudoviricetes sp.]